MPLPVVSDATVERVTTSPDHGAAQRWENLPPEMAALVRGGLIMAAQVRKEAETHPVDPGDAVLRGVDLAIAAYMEQAASDTFVSAMAGELEVA